MMTLNKAINRPRQQGKSTNSETKRPCQQMPVTCKISSINLHTNWHLKPKWRAFCLILDETVCYIRYTDDYTWWRCMATKNWSTRRLLTRGRKYENALCHVYDESLGPEVDVDFTMYIHLQAELEYAKQRYILAANQNQDPEEYRPTWATPRCQEQIPTCAHWTTRSYSKLNRGYVRQWNVLIAIHISPNISYFSGNRWPWEI